MRVKMNNSTVYQGQTYHQGEEYDAEKKVAEQWIDRNIATEVKAKKESTKKIGDK